jgi:hypothetical protein
MREPTSGTVSPLEPSRSGPRISALLRVLDSWFKLLSEHLQFQPPTINCEIEFQLHRFSQSHPPGNPSHPSPQSSSPRFPHLTSHRQPHITPNTSSGCSTWHLVRQRLLRRLLAELERID